jgi:hypothetical protein
MFLNIRIGMLAAAVASMTVSTCSVQAAEGPSAELSPAQQITRACKLAENQQHPACVKRAEARAKSKARAEARDQAVLDSILGRDPGVAPKGTASH